MTQTIYSGGQNIFVNSRINLRKYTYRMYLGLMLGNESLRNHFNEKKYSHIHRTEEYQKTRQDMSHGQSATNTDFRSYILISFEMAHLCTHCFLQFNNLYEFLKMDTHQEEELAWLKMLSPMFLATDSQYLLNSCALSFICTGKARMLDNIVT